MASYRLAGEDIWFSNPIAEIERYKTEDGGTLRFRREQTPAALVRILCRTTGLVGGSLREVECWDAPPGILLKVAGASDFLVILSPTTSIHQIRGDPGDAARNQAERGTIQTALDVEVALGPALILGLAFSETFCFHASAVAIGGKVIAFAGDSGRGKSTLARELASRVALGAQWVADDILPVTTSESGTFALPRFPQLKVPAAAQPGASLPESLPLDSIFVLEEAESTRPLTIERLDPVGAVKMILSHTVGSRMFSSELLRRHFEFCANVAAGVPVFRLHYPHAAQSISEVQKLLVV